MPLTAEQRAARRESRRANREQNNKISRNSLQGYQTESARLFGLSTQSSSNDSSNLVLSSNDSSALDNSFNSATNRRAADFSQSLAGIDEGLDHSEDTNKYAMMQPPGQDAAQGGSPRHRVGPFEKDSDDEYYDEEGGETNSGGMNNINPFLDDSIGERSGSNNSRSRRGGSSSPEREFQPAKLDRSGTSSKQSKNEEVGNSFDTDDDAQFKTRPNNLVASVVTTSSSTTQRAANTDDDSRKKTARDKFMEVMPDDDDEEDEEDTAVDYGTPLNYDAVRNPFDSDDENASQRSYEPPRSYKPFSGGSQQSESTGGEHYASMQELLEEERTRNFVSNKPSRFGGFVESCLGGKRTKRRKITLIAIVVVLCVVIGVSVYSIVLGPAGDKKGQVESQNMQQIERPGSNFVPGKSGNVSSPDTTFGMTGNSTDDLLDFEPTFPVDSGGEMVTATSDTSSPTSSPITTSSLVPTPSVSENNPTGFKTTSPPSDPPTLNGSDLFPGLESETEIPTGYPSETKSYPPTAAPTETLQPPTGSPSAAPFTSAPFIAPTNPPISASVPSVQTDISGVLTFNEPVPQDTEANLIMFLDALKKSIRSTVTSTLEDKDELVYVEIVSINGSPVESLLLSRRFIRRRMQIGSEVEYEMVVLTDCDLSDCTDADAVASDVFYRATNQMSTSVYSGEFASVLEVNVLSSSGGDIEYLSEVIVGDFSQPKVSVLAPTEDQMANETSITSSTIPADVTTTNGTVPIDSSESEGDETITSRCEFCEGGMPNPFLVVSDSGINCNQLKEAASISNSDSNTCKTVKQAEILCCELTTTTEDSTDVSVMNSTSSADTNSTETPLTSAADGDEAILTNSTFGANETEVLLSNSTLDDNETTVYNETISSNSTAEEWDFVIIDTVVGNETVITYGDPPIKYENETSLDTTNDTSGAVMDIVDSNETLVLDAMPEMYENGTFSDFENDALYPDLSCPDALIQSIKIDELSSLYYEVVPSSPFEARNGILCARLEVRSLGWVGFALSRDGSMIGSEAVIGLPNENTVMKYSLLGKSPGMIFKLSEERQSLRETSIYQDFEVGTTTMEFVKLLDEDDEIPIMMKGPNNFLFARGMSNAFGYHLGRVSFMKDFREDIDVPIDFDGSNGSISSNSTFEDDADLLNTTNSMNMTEVEGVDSFANTTVTPVSTEAPMMTLCEFCEDGLPDPFLIVSDSGLNCNQLKEAVSGRDSDSSFCVTVKEAEGLCCEDTSTSTDTTYSSEVSDVTNSTISEEGDLDGMDTSETMNSTLDANDSVDSNETSVSDSTSEEWDYVIVDTVVGNETLISYEDPPMKSNETSVSDSTTSEEWDYVIIDTVVGNETLISYEDPPMKYENELDDNEVNLSNETTSSNTTSEEWDFVIIDTVVGNETVITYGDPPPMKNDSDISPGMIFENLPIMYENGTFSDFENDALYPDKTEAVDSTGNKTTVSNSTSEEWDFAIIENVVGNETLITYEELPPKYEDGATASDATYEDLPIMYENGTFSDFENDALYPDKNSILGESNGDTTSATDIVEPAIMFDELSFPFTLNQELGGLSSSELFGFSVTISGDGSIVAVGAKDTTDALLGEVGSVRLYSMETSPPTLLQTLVNAYPSGEYGCSIALSNNGNRLVVGARSENDQTGVVRVYGRGRDTLMQWALVGLPIDGLSSGERAGWSVSISGDGTSIAVGSPKGGSTASGSVVTYRLENRSNWVPYGSALEGVLKEAFGYSTSISYDGNLVAVGSPKATNSAGASNAGKVSVFYLYGTEWLPLPATAIQGTSANDIVGNSIALSQDGAVLVVGSKGGDSDNGVDNVGLCYIYEFGTDPEFGTDWVLLHTIEGMSKNERLGSSVAVSRNGDVVACGGEKALIHGVGTGVVRVWNRATSESSTIWPRSIDDGAMFGSALSVNEDGKVLAVGAPERDSMISGSNAGAVDIFENITS